jgi:hypothetical protein
MYFCTVQCIINPYNKSILLLGGSLRYSLSREYWVFYRGPGFIAVLWFGSPPLPSVNSTEDTQDDWERETTCLQGEGVVEEPNHTSARKPWSLNHSIFSACGTCRESNRRLWNVAPYLVTPQPTTQTRLYFAFKKFSKLVNSKVAHVYVLVQYRTYTRTVHTYKHRPSSSLCWCKAPTT